MGAAGQRAISHYKQARDRSIKSSANQVVKAARANASGRKVKRRSGKTARGITAKFRSGRSPAVEFVHGTRVGSILERGRRETIVIPKRGRGVFISSGPLKGRFFARVRIPAQRGIPIIGDAVKQQQAAMNRQIHRDIVPVIDKELSRVIEVR